MALGPALLERFFVNSENVIMHTVAHLSTAKAIWDELKRVYAKPGSVGAFVHFQQLFNSTLSDKSPLRPQLDAIHIRKNHILCSPVSKYKVLQGIKQHYQMLQLLQSHIDHNTRICRVS